MAMQYAQAEQALAFLSVIDTVKAEQAARLGVGTGVLLCLVRVAGVCAVGGPVRAADLPALGLGDAGFVRLNVAACLRLGWLERVKGRLLVTPLGRNVLSEYVRAWQRSAKALQRLEHVSPYPSVSRPKERGKAARQQERAKKKE